VVALLDYADVAEGEARQGALDAVRRAMTFELDVTAEVAYALEAGDVDFVEPLLPEWRGALFRVRLARLRALERTSVPRGSDGAAELPPRRQRERPSVSALVATGLVIVGAFLFTAGAVLAAWPVWAAGLALFAGGFVLYR